LPLRVAPGETPRHDVAARAGLTYQPTTTASRAMRRASHAAERSPREMPGPDQATHPSCCSPTGGA
jgi:hypothetical protein